MQADSLVQ